MQTDLEIVAANGTPINTVGYSLPVLNQENNCFILGGRPDNSFDFGELDDLAATGKVTIIDPPIPFSRRIGNYTAKIKKERGVNILLSPVYIFYRDTPQLDHLGVQVESRIPEQTPRVYFPLKFGHYEAFAMDNSNVKDALRDTYEAVEKTLVSILKARKDLSNADVVATVLYQSAFDKASAKKAISYKGISVKFTDEKNHYDDWAIFVAKFWGLGRTKKYWKREVRALEKSLKS